MTKISTITTLFNRNIFSLEINNLLTSEGFNLIELNDVLSLKNQVNKGGILVVGIDSDNMLDEFSIALKKTKNTWKVLCILERNIVCKTNDFDLKILTQPIIFNDFLNIILYLQKNLNDAKMHFKLGGLKYFPKTSKLFNQEKGEIKLTDLENKLILHFIKNTQGSTKEEILKKVWKHNASLDTHTLESLIYRLRRKIEIDPNKPKILVQLNKKYFLDKSHQ